MFNNSYSRPAHSHTVYNHPVQYIRHIAIFVVLVATLIPTGISATASTATVQDFDIPNAGTPYVPLQIVNPPPPTVMSGGPTGVGKFLRLVSAVGDSINTITFPSTAPPADWIVSDFDFRITPGNAINGTGRADGFSFALLSNEATGVQGEEPNFAGSFGIGFDIYKNTDLGDIGNVNILPTFSNSLSIHFDGQLIKQVDATRVVDLAEGRWIHARIMLRPGGGFSDVSVILTPQNCGPVTLIKNLLIPGLTPYEGRVYFGARTGGETAHHDIDNIRVQFLKLTQSVLSLSAFSYNVGEANPSATVTVMRTGNTQTTVQVDYTTADAAAKAGTDYTPASGTLMFGPGEFKKQFTVPILHTPGLEADEIFQVYLKNLKGAFVGGPAKAVVKIFDVESSQAVGRWSPPMCWPIVAVHMHLLPTRKVLFWDRLGNISFWDPANQQITTPIRLEHNLFCSGHAFLEDGQLLVTGGHDHHAGGPSGDGIGLKQASAYNPFTNEWTMLTDMNNGRWYPTNTALANGQMLVISGTYSTSPPNPVITLNLLPQVWRPANNTWRNLTGAASQPENPQAHGVDLYPRMFLAPDGRVFKAGPDKDTWFLNTAGTGQWVRGPDSNFGLRSYGTAVMYEPGKILIVGGGDVDGSGPDATSSAEVIDLNTATPAWRTVASMQFARRHLNATLLADGTVLVTGGTGAPGSNNEANPVLRAELWNPVSETWTALPAMQVTRGYHSTALLLPDGRVLVAGGGQGAGAVGNHNNAEIFSPAYLFKGARPEINAVPATITYGQSFTVSTPDAANITKVSLIRLSSVTHAFDQNQRFTWLNFSPTGNALSVTAPANGNITPPGHYMLFILNSNGVPSIAKIIKIN